MLTENRGASRGRGFKRFGKGLGLFGAVFFVVVVGHCYHHHWFRPVRRPSGRSICERENRWRNISRMTDRHEGKSKAAASRVGAGDPSTSEEAR